MMRIGSVVREAMERKEFVTIDPAKDCRLGPEVELVVLTGQERV